jgi:glutaminyl-peptide cyclotransferase
MRSVSNQIIVRSTILRWLAVACLFPALAPSIFAQSAEHKAANHPPEYTFKVIRTFPHDPEAFTQGLVYQNGFFYEGTGLNGHSTLRKVQLETGKVIQRINLASDHFGEGIAILGNQIFQLTWQSHTGFVYNLSDFHLLRRVSYPGEGWGLTTDGHDLYMSDGTPDIRVIDPATFTEKRRLIVHDGSITVKDLNELEWVGDELYANIWQTDRIARISPRDGEVTGWIDLKGLLSPVYTLQPGAVLNGIAYDSAHKRLFVTGKLWPTIFEIQLVPKH